MTDFATFVNIIIDELTKEGRKHTAETRKYSSNRLLMFMGDNPTPMDKWDDLFVLNYETWLKTQGLSASTTAFYLSQLCAFYKQAVKKGKIQGHDIFRLVNKTPAPKLAAQQFPSIAELRYLQTLNLNKSQDFARDMFLFSLYARGMNYVDMAYLKKSNVKDGMLTYISHTSDNNPAVTIKWDKAMQQIADKYTSDTEYMFPIITKEGNADETEQIKRSRHNVVYNLRSIGKLYKFSVSPTIAMTKDLWRKIMDEVSVSEVI